MCAFCSSWGSIESHVLFRVGSRRHRVPQCPPAASSIASSNLPLSLLLTIITPPIILNPPSPPSSHPAPVLLRFFPQTAMASLGLRRLVAVAVALLPALPTAQVNSSYSQVDMLRAELELMNTRPKDCPPW